MVNFLSEWAEQVVVAVVIGSIIEMILPNNNTKKYIKMVIGIYILFTIIYPIINNKDKLSMNNIDINKFSDNNYNLNNQEFTEVNQESMDERLQKLYIDELEKNIQSKVLEEGFSIYSCKVDADLFEKDDEKGIKNIRIVLLEKVNKDNNIKDENQLNVNKIDDIKIKVGLDKKINGKNKEENIKISNSDINELKKTLGEYYEIESNRINISIK